MWPFGRRPDIEKLRRKRDVSGLIRALRYQSYEVIDPAADALAELRESAAVEPLVGALRRRRLTGGGRHVIVALGELGDSRAVGPLLEVLREQPFLSDDERNLAASALAKLGDHRALEPLMILLEESQTAGEVLDAIASFGETAVEPLIRVLVAGRRNSAYKAPAILATIGDKRAVEPLISVLGYFEGPIAASALARIGDQQAIRPILHQLLKCQEEDHSIAQVNYVSPVFERALGFARPLAALGDEGISALIAAKNNDYVTVKKAAEHVLKEAGYQSDCSCGICNVLKVG